MFDIEERLVLLNDTHRLISTGHLTISRLYRAGGPNDFLPLPLHGITPGWVLESLIGERHMRSIQRYGRLDRQQLMRGRTGYHWQYALMAADYDGLQHRIVLPLLGSDVRTMLAEVTGGETLTQVMSTPRGETAFSIQAARTILSAPGLLEGVSDLPAQPFELIGPVLKEVVHVAGAARLPGEAVCKGGREVVTSACLPREMLALLLSQMTGHGHRQH